MKCPHCGDTKQSKDADFCNQCGYHFSVTAEEVEVFTSAGKQTVRLAVNVSYPVYHGGLDGCGDIAYLLRYQPHTGDCASAGLVMHKDGSPTQTGEVMLCGTCHQPLSHFYIVRDGIYEAI